MPIYEYESLDPERGCALCHRRFERIEGVASPALAACPQCGKPVKRVISWCHGAVCESSSEQRMMEERISSYEREGMWSHAAELADKHSERTKDPDLRNRALEDYKKAGYNLDTLEKHAKSKME
jgi:putative FmdB family regulatory protein